MPVLQIRQVQQASAGQEGTRRRVRCIGCHVATPDDGFVAFVDDWPWNLAIAGVKPGIVGQPLPGLTDGGLAALNLPWGGMMAFSRAYWAPGKRLVVLASSLQNYSQRWATDNRAPGQAALVQPRLARAAWRACWPRGMQLGEVKREGDPRGAACPTWSHDGTPHRVFVHDGRQPGRRAERRAHRSVFGAVQRRSRRPGDAARWSGRPDVRGVLPRVLARTTSWWPYTRVPQGQRMYANKQAEIAVVPGGGRDRGAPGGQRSARRAPARRARASTTTGPSGRRRWAAAGGRKYYWLLFSSNRADIPPVMRRYPDPAGTGEPLVQVTQLYMTVVVVEGDQDPELPGGLSVEPARPTR